MDYSVIANLTTILVSNKLNGSTAKTVTSSSAINIRGTIVGNLANVLNTKTYMSNYSRYNNYLTSNLGAAQMAADRYMSLKERIPMSFEYYSTPTTKKEVVMYINPQKLSVSTQKVKGKVYTRGGIYYHHYGDDHWTMSLSGTVGYAQMRGIEALEEIYHNSGALLKYQNISVSTVHTNQITTASSSSSSNTISSLISSLTGSNSAVSKYLGKVVSTATDAIGLTGDGTTSLATKLGLNNSSKTASSTSSQNLFSAIAGGVANAITGVNNNATISNATTGIVDLMKATNATTGDATNFAGYFSTLSASLKQSMSTTSSSITNAIAADAVSTILGNGSSATNLSNIIAQLNSGATSSFSTILNILNGNFTAAASTALPQQATSGNFYSLGNMTATELNNVVATVQSYNSDHTINKTAAASSYADIEDQLTDQYRPRQVFVYFDDRVYIGHFDSFTWNRSAEHPLIYYDMKFTVTRQIKITSTSSNSTTTSSSSTSLKNLLTTTAVSALASKVFGTTSS